MEEYQELDTADSEKESDHGQSSSGPGQAKKPRIIALKDEPLDLLCEWGECTFNSDDMDKFLDHVTSHLKEVLAENDAVEESKDYQCNWKSCDHVASNYTELVRHVYFHAFHVKIKCIGTNLLKRFSMENCSIDSHCRNMIPELPERLHCAWQECESIYDNPEHFYRHVEGHVVCLPDGNHPKGGVTCMWNGCTSHVRNKHKLGDHIRCHTQEKRAACPTCGGLFATRIKLFDHIKRQSSTVQNFQCSHCNKKFTSERLLRNHMRTHVNRYKCPYCEMTCPTPSTTQNHIKYRHNEEKPYSCEYCDYSCKSRTDLRRHLDTHDENPQFTCHIEGCQFNAHSFSSLNNHFKLLHQKEDLYRYACHLCSATFTRGNILTKHLMSLHKFVWPPGHSRFRYKVHEDGFHRLQTVRYESVELTEQLMEDDLSKGSHSLGSEDTRDSLSLEAANLNKLISQQDNSQDDEDINS